MNDPIGDPLIALLAFTLALSSFLSLLFYPDFGKSARHRLAMDFASDRKSRLATRDPTLRTFRNRVPASVGIILTTRITLAARVYRLSIQLWDDKTPVLHFPSFLLKPLASLARSLSFSRFFFSGETP
jgi:hypothetical protein